jgi:release factor glutamine methyltransferase
MPPAALHDVLSAAVRRLRDAGIEGEAAAADVDVLARYVLGWDRARLLARRLDPVPDGFVDRFQPLIDRRATRAPVAYLTGTREFYGLLFEVTPAVLVPRPETELAVEAALACLAGGGDPPRVVDVGTGSGCIAVALATARRDAALFATARSRAALAVARRNARRHHVDGRLRLLAADTLDAFAPDAGFDLVVSNPPYVPVDSPEVWADVRAHEPASALYAGADGLDVIRRLIAAAPGRLRAGGHLVIEIGAGQAPAVAELAAAAGTWAAPVRFRLDLQGIARVAVLSRGGSPGR